MKLRTKTLITIGLTIIILVLAIYLISHVLLINSLTDIEEKSTRQDVTLAGNLLLNDLLDLNNITQKWAGLEYFSSEKINQSQNEEYIQNLISSSGIDLLIVLDPSGKVIYSKSYNSTSNEIDSNTNLLNYISQNKQLSIKNSSNNGIILLQNDSMLISSQPIKSKNNNYLEGTLILGKDIESTEIEKLNNELISFSIIPFDNVGVYPQFYDVSQTFSQNSVILTKNEVNSSQGFYILRNQQGTAVLELKATEPHQILNQGFQISSYFIFSFLVIGSVLSLVILFYLDNMVLSRINRLSENMLNIAQNRKSSHRLDSEGNDELSVLAKNINQMLASLEKSYGTIVKSRKKYKTIFQNTGTAMAIHEENGIISLVNTEFEKLSGYTKKEIEGNKSWTEFFTSEDVGKMREYGKFCDSYPHKVPKNYEFRFLDKKGEIKNVCVTVATIPLNKQVLISYLDITNLRKSFEEKELLIREIHHRVKNNFQIIDSLLSLQSGYIPDKESHNVFLESRGRIRSMAMIHEELYNSKDLARINFTNYLEKLVKGLYQSYGADEKDIKLKIMSDKVLLGIETAVPLGLLINELITNSIKHAFPDKKGGTIYIKLYKVNDNIELIIGDNGMGIPKYVDIGNTGSLGLKLVNSLTRQIDGTMKIDISNGTEFTILFSELNYKKRI